MTINPHLPRVHPSSLRWPILNDFISNCHIHFNSSQLEQTSSLIKLDLDVVLEVIKNGMLVHEPSKTVRQRAGGFSVTETRHYSFHHTA